MNDYVNWRDDDLNRLESIEGYAEMCALAVEIISRLPRPVSQLCGPISTGGRGSIDANIEMFGEGISFLVGQGKVVFDQRPFEMPMQRVKILRGTNGYPFDLLEEFYLPLFQSGRINELHFLPGWESSTGARWEHEKAILLDIPIFYLSASFLSVARALG